MKPSSLENGVAKALVGLLGPHSGQTLVLGLSGGADSVALLDALVSQAKALGMDLVAAHLDHGLRPDSADDEAFCRDLCQRLGVRFRSGRADVRGRARRDRRGLEDAARRERHAFLRVVKNEVGASAIALAHTRDDQAETVLLRLIRGSGRLGLSGMRARSADLVRPLLGVSRQEVLRHLRARGLAWREDPTNADPSFRRNRVRHELLPYLETRFNPSVRSTLGRIATVLADEAAYLRQLSEAYYEQAALRDCNEVWLSRRRLCGLPKALGRLVIRRALEDAGCPLGPTARQVERLLALAGSPRASGKRLALPRGREAIVFFDELRLRRRQEPAVRAPFAVPLAVPGEVALPDGSILRAETDSGPAVSHRVEAVVAAPEEAGPPLLVRTRRPGDRVRWHGRDVSLKRFLMQRRVVAEERACLPLVAAGSQVLFVPGLTVESPPGNRFVRLSLLERALA